MANVLSRDKQISALHHLVEDNTLRSTSRLLGVHRDTITRLMVRFGDGCQRLMDDKIRGLSVNHVEVDEIHTYCQKRQKNLTVEEKQTRHDCGEIYLWTAIEKDSKLCLSHVVGKRTGDNARKLMRDMASRLVFPRPHESDAHAFLDGGYKPICQISTDMLAAYPEAVDQFFGPYAKYGQIRKDYRNANMPGNYSPTEMVATERRPIKGNVMPWSICTSHVERHNLTIRTLMKRFTRLGLGFSKKLENLQAACSLFLGYYNYVWRTRYEDWSGKRGTLRPTAAMMAGVTDTLWNFETLFDSVSQYL